MIKPISSVKGLFILLGLFFSVHTLTAQSSMPPGANNYLQVTGHEVTGSLDNVNVVFFEVPDTVTSQLYFGVQSAGNTGVAAELDGVAGGATTSYYLIGGNGALSNSNSQKYKYTTAEVSANQHLTGAQLDSFSYLDNAAYPAWRYFSPVNPSQGEHIGNKYFFKVVTVITSGTDSKNAYRLDISSSPSNPPTTIPGVLSFAYDLCIALRVNGSNEWPTYPFVPAGSTGYIVFSGFDFDADTAGVTVGTAYNKANAQFQTTGTLINNINNALSGGATSTIWNRSFAVSGQVDGVWLGKYTENFAAQATAPSNTSEIWYWLNGTSITEEKDINAIPPPNQPASNATLRIYSSWFSPPTPDHVIIQPTSTTALVSPGSTTLTLQVVDASGQSALAAVNVYVQLSSATARIAGSVPVAGGLPAQNAVITTDSNGLATITVTDTAAESVNITLTTNGTSGSTSLPNTVANNSSTITFQTNPPPTISSSMNLTFTEGTAATVPTISVADSGTADITVANDFRIQIPAGLNAVFDTGASVTLTMGGTSVGKVHGGNTYTGVLTYENGNTRAVVGVTTNFAVGDTLTISGLAFTNANTNSSGSLTASYGGAGGPYGVIDDKVITITPSGTIYTWVGGTGGAPTDWNTTTNWTPNGVPNTNTESAVIPSAPLNQPSIPNGTNFTLKNLTIDSGGSANVTMNGNTITVQGAFSNDGTLRLRGDETLTFTGGMDTNSGTVEYYSAAGGTLIDFGAPDYYNLRIIGGGTWGVSAALSAYSLDLNTTTAGTLNLGNFDLTMTTALSMTNSAGQLVQGAGTFIAPGFSLSNGIYNGAGNGTISLSGALALTGGTFSLGNKNLTCTTFSQTVGGTYNGNTGTISSSGSVTLSGGTHNSNSYTLIMTGGGTSLTCSANRNPFNLTVNAGGAVTLGFALVLGGTMTISGGALDAGANYQITVGGNWSNTVGAAGFVERNGTVVFNGNGAMQ
ncbi:MAG: hypothetical protein JXD23_16625, partial [Spirochaetales bacterium]|nr:hypothetical protein [Spirochaetales bacterium]